MAVNNREQNVRIKIRGAKCHPVFLFYRIFCVWLLKVFLKKLEKFCRKILHCGYLYVIMLIVTFCLVDMFDTIGTLYGTAAQANMLDENGDPQDIEKCMMCDSIATTAGAMVGVSTVTTFVESASGVAEGGKTGLTSLVIAALFAVCLFLTPLASIIPGVATAPALIYVGVLMLKNFKAVDMDDLSSAIPAFLALTLMPLTYSISNGIAIGAISYVLIQLLTGKFSKKDIVVTVIAILFVLRYVFVPAM